MLPQVLKNMKTIPKKRLLNRLTQKGVQIFTDTEVKSLRNNQINLVEKGGNEFTLKIDTVVLALPSTPDKDFIKKVEKKFQKVILVGDSKVPGNLGSALRSGLQAILSI